MEELEQLRNELELLDDNAVEVDDSIRKIEARLLEERERHQELLAELMSRKKTLLKNAYPKRITLDFEAKKETGYYAQYRPGHLPSSNFLKNSLGLKEADPAYKTLMKLPKKFHLSIDVDELGNIIGATVYNGTNRVIADMSLD